MNSVFGVLDGLIAYILVLQGVRPETIANQH